MSDIFTEVDESIRQDRIQTLWKRWRPFVFGGVALLIGVVALNEFVLTPAAEARQAERAYAFESAVKALQDGNYTEAQAAFTAIRDNDPKLGPLAAHYLAQTLYEGGGDAAGAADILASIGTAEGGPFERLALLKTAYFRADTLSLQELEATLGSLVTDDTATGVLARELVAAKAFEAGDYARARTEFNRLRLHPSAPEGVIRRAEVALAAIPQATAAPAEAPSEATTEDPAPAEEAAPETPQETGQ